MIVVLLMTSSPTMFIRLSSLRMSTRTVSESERSVSELSRATAPRRRPPRRRRRLAPPAAAGCAVAGGGRPGRRGRRAGRPRARWPGNPATAASTASWPAVLPKTRSKLIVSGEDSSELGSVEMISPIALSLSEIAPRSLSKVSKVKRASTR